MREINLTKMFYEPKNFLGIVFYNEYLFTYDDLFFNSFVVFAALR